MASIAIEINTMHFAHVYAPRGCNLHQGTQLYLKSPFHSLAAVLLVRRSPWDGAPTYALRFIPDHTIATFLPPLSYLKIHTWWQDRANEVISGSRDILFVMAPKKSREVTGVVMLRQPEAETGPFRGMVEKLLVSPDWRRKGVGRALMKGLEDVAREKGKTLLMLDTETGSPAEQFYPGLRYVKVGVIPNYGISSKDGILKSETFFYKDLRTSKPL